MMKNETPFLKRLSIAAWSGVALLAIGLVALQSNRMSSVSTVASPDATRPSLSAYKAVSEPSLRNALVEERVEGADRDLTALGSLCREGHAESCWVLGQRMDLSSGDDALPWFKQGCRLGDSRSCEQIVSISREPASVKTALDQLRRSCESKNDGESCRVLAKAFEELGAKDQASEFADKACVKGSANSCLDLALMQLEETEDNPQALEPVRRFCDLKSHQAGETSAAKRLCLEMKSVSTITKQMVRRLLKANLAYEQASLDYTGENLSARKNL